MPTALWQLLWFDLRGTLRALADLRRNWRKMFLFGLVLALIGLMLYARAVSSFDASSSRFGEAMPFWALIYLLSTWLTASADRGLVMRPAEIHFIAGGPFRDRDVITLNLIRLAIRASVSAAVLSLIASGYVASYPSTLVGFGMLISVSLLVGMLASLSARSSQAAIVKVLRRLLTVTAIVGVLWLIAQSITMTRSQGLEPRISTVAASASETSIGSVVLPPLAWMFKPVASPRFFPDTLALLPTRLGIIAVLVLGVYVLGGSYLETSTSRTDQSIARRQSALRSGATVKSGLLTRISLPMLPHLGGIGSVAWMQIIHSLRILPRFLVFTTVIVGVVLVVPIMVDRERISGIAAIGWMAGLTAYADFLLLLQLPVGFLGPVAQREMLKSLPSPAWRIVLGQLAGPIIPVSILHILVAVLFLFLVPDSTWLILQTAVALIPAAIIVIGNINLLGVWNIIRPRALQQRDALAAGRAMLSVWVFFAMLMPAIVMATVFAIFASLLFGEAPSSYLFGAAIGGLLASTLYIILIARSFKNWQPAPSEGGAEEVELDR